MSPERFRTIVSTVLLVGVSISALLIGTGFVLALAVGWEGSLLGQTAATGSRTDFGELPPALVALRPVGITQLGLIVPVATPVLRVATSVVGFAREGDRRYVAITLIVLAILLMSLFVLR